MSIFQSRFDRLTALANQDPKTFCTDIDEVHRQQTREWLHARAVLDTLSMIEVGQPETHPVRFIPILPIKVPFLLETRQDARVAAGLDPVALADFLGSVAGDALALYIMRADEANAQ